MVVASRKCIHLKIARDHREEVPLETRIASFIMRSHGREAQEDVRQLEGARNESERIDDD
jgi:hypothetical protein